MKLMDNKKLAAVVVPFYKTSLGEFEKISLTQCFKVLSAHPIIAIKPQSLNLSEIPGCENFVDVVSFDDAYFKNVQGYNHLMLSSVFYQQFLDYEFILIHQLDAFVFINELAKWAHEDYDYIGAPWLKRIPDKGNFAELITIIKTKFYTYFNIFKYGLPSDRQFDNAVGNGGFSLRKVRVFYELSKKCKPQMEAYLHRAEHKFHEDAFWSIEVNRKKRRLKIPGYKKALLFSFENDPERCLKYTDNQLPFGCHAWGLHIDFWRPYFENQGYLLPVSKSRDFN